MENDPSLSESSAVFERRSLVLGRGDVELLEDLTRMAVHHRWKNANRSTIIRALIRIAAGAYKGGLFPANEFPWSLHLHEHLPLELAQINSESAPRGPRPGSRRPVRWKEPPQSGETQLSP